MSCKNENGADLAHRWSRLAYPQSALHEMRERDANVDASSASRIKQLAAILLHKEWLRVSILVLIGAVVHAPALSGQFVWDDEYLARDNPFIKSPLFLLEVFRHHLFLDSFSGHYRPVQNISLMVDYFFWNSNTFGFHLTNVILHVGSGVLLYFLLRRILRSLASCRQESGGSSDAASLPATLAFVIASLWVVHPVHSAAVDYISGRADCLAFFLACGGWLFYLRARETTQRFGRIAQYAMAACAGLLALCSRETALIWLFIFLLYALFFERNQPRRSRVLVLAACLSLLGTYSFLRHLPEDRPAPAPSYEWSRPMRGVLMLRALGDYGRLMVFPSNLHMERTLIDPGNYQSTQSWRHSVASEYLSIAGLILLTGLLWGSCRKGVGQLARIFGAGWFLMGYLPISNFIELNATVAEHWLYLPSVGLLIFLAGGMLDLPIRRRRLAFAIAGLALVGLSVRSAFRSADWVSQRSFYERTIAAGGMSTRVGVNLAEIYASSGDYAKAEAIYRQVIAMTPDYPIARNNLATILYRQGKRAQAEDMFSAASRTAVETRKQYPHTWVAALNRAHLCHGDGHDSEALAILEKARIGYPGTWELVSLESELLRETKKPAAAFRLVSDFARDHWWHYGAAVALGRLYAQEGNVPRAEAALRHASWLDVHDAEALNLIASMSLRQDRFEDAYRTQRRAVARQPDQPRQYVLLSAILQKMGRPAEAKLAVAEVTRLETLAQRNGSLGD